MGSGTVISVQVGYNGLTMSREVSVALTPQQFRMVIAQIHELQNRLLGLGMYDIEEE